MRQQRADSARGKLPFKRLATATEITWTIGAIAGLDVTLQFQELTSGWFLNGIPAFKILENAALPSAAVLTPSGVTLTYAGLPAGTFNIQLPQNDPAIRTGNGGYVAPGIQTWFVAPALSSGSAEFIAGAGDSPVTKRVTVFNDIANAGAFVLPGAPSAGANYLMGVAQATGTVDVKDAALAVISGVPVGAWQAATWDGAAWGFS